MSYRDDLTIDWSLSPRIITIADPNSTDEITCQDLYDTVRTICSSTEAIAHEEIIEGTGKEELGAGILVGLTIKLYNAKVKFADKPSATVCNIRGGNLIAVTTTGGIMIPIEASTNVSTVISQSASATLISGIEIVYE